MNATRDVLQVVQTVVFVVVGTVAVYRWVRLRGATRAWVAATFGSLGFVVGIAIFLPDEPPPGPTPPITRFLVAILVLFPYFLFRFAATFRRRGRALEVFALVSTVGLVLGQFAIERFPGQDEPQPASLRIFTFALAAQWTVLLGAVAIDLWRSGRGQPTVSRRRMKFLAVGAVSLVLALAGGVVSGSSTDATPASIVVQLLGIASAPLFLLGFAPPSFVLASWRRPELLELREAEAGLMQALSPGEVGERLLPRVTRIVGGKGAALFDGEGKLLQVRGITEQEAQELHAQVRQTPRFDASRTDVVWVQLDPGMLLVKATPYTPYFGRDEAELLHTLATFTDLAMSRARISERERATARELETANEAMREFVAIASHDLRTPITVIKGFTQTLEMQWAEITDDQRARFLSTIHRHVDHLSAIVDDLLTSSRLDSGAIVPSLQTIDLRSFVERLLNDLDPDHSLAGVIDIPMGLRASADPNHLDRILSNLVSNARRYGSPPVVVSAEGDGSGVVLRVCDSGPGLDPAFASRAFEKFARADTRRSKESQGTGLGLAIVRGLAKASGGDAWYERSDSQGGCFVIRLPA